MKNKEKRTGIEGLFNTREVGGIGKAIREEYYPRPKKIEKEIPEDAKQEEKFEPFYEGEGKQTIEDVVDSESGSATTQEASEIVGDKPFKPKRQNRRDGSDAPREKRV